MSLRILVTGSRAWTDEAAIFNALADALATYSTMGLPVLVHGGCRMRRTPKHPALRYMDDPPRGGDAIADSIWRHWIADGRLLAEPEIYWPDWFKHGAAAGPLRNEEMVRSGITVALAFPLGQSKGTRGCIALCERAAIPVVITEGAET